MVELKDILNIWIDDGRGKSTIYLDNGRKIRGQLIAAGDDYIEMNTRNDAVLIRTECISAITRRKG